MRVIVTTCNKTSWTLRPFAHLFNAFWSSLQSVEVLCESIPTFILPDNFTFYQVGFQDSPHEWAVNRWTDGLLKYLNSIRDQQVLILLDDYWFVRTVDFRGIGTLCEYMQGNENVLRMDLTTDRLYAGGVPRPHEYNDFAMWGHYDLLSIPGSAYQMSLMPAIWNKARLMEVLELGWSPWDVEIKGTEKINNDMKHLVCLGTRQFPIRMVNALRAKDKNIYVKGIPEDHYQVIKPWLMSEENLNT